MIALLAFLAACSELGPASELGGTSTDGGSSDSDAGLTPTTNGDTDPDNPASTTDTAPDSTNTSLGTAPSDSGDTAAAAGTRGLGDSLFAAAGNGGYDVTHYDLDLDLTGNGVEARATLTLETLQALSEFSIDFVGFTIIDVRLDEDPVDFERVDGELVVTRPSPLSAGETTTVTVSYRGAPELVADPIDKVDLGLYSRSWGYFVLAEPIGAHAWFPANDHPRDKATVQLTLRVPDGVIAVGPGLLSEEHRENGAAVSVWQTREPVAPYLVSFIVGDLDSTLTTVGDRPFRVVSPPEVDVSDAAGLHAELYTQLETWFGPYPFASYGIAVVPESLPFAALENQTLSLFSRDALASTQAERTQVHEFAHQWFGNHVSVADWSDIWLNEGFATWVDHRWSEEHGDSRAFDDLAARDPGWGPLTDITPGTMFSPTVYYRGALALEALNRQAGEENFFRLLRRWLTEFGGGAASTQDFEDMTRAELGDDAASLLHSWLHDAEMPPWP